MVTNVVLLTSVIELWGALAPSSRLTRKNLARLLISTNRKRAAPTYVRGNLWKKKGLYWSKVNWDSLWASTRRSRKWLKELIQRRGTLGSGLSRRSPMRVRKRSRKLEMIGVTAKLRLRLFFSKLLGASCPSRYLDHRLELSSSFIKSNQRS